MVSSSGCSGHTARPSRWTWRPSKRPNSWSSRSARRGWNWPSSWQRAMRAHLQAVPAAANISNAGSPKRKNWWTMTTRKRWRAEFAPAIEISWTSGRNFPPALPIDKTRQAVARLNDDLAVNSLLAPAKELLALEERLIHKSSDRNQDMADRVAVVLWLLGTCGAVAGLVAGFGIARGISHSIVNLYVPIRAASGRLEEVIGPVDIAPARGIEHLDEILRSMADHVGTVVDRLQQTRARGPAGGADVGPGPACRRSGPRAAQPVDVAEAAGASGGRGGARRGPPRPRSGRGRRRNRTARSIAANLPRFRPPSRTGEAAGRRSPGPQPDPGVGLRPRQLAKG